MSGEDALVVVSLAVSAQTEGNMAVLSLPSVAGDSCPPGTLTCHSWGFCELQFPVPDILSQRPLPPGCLLY